MRGDIIPPQRPVSSRNNRPVVSPQPTARPRVDIVAPDIAEPQVPPKEVMESIKPTVEEAQEQRRIHKVGRFAGRSGVLWALIVAGAVLIATIGLLGWYGYQLKAVGGETSEKVVVQIDPGTGLSDIAAILKSSKLIRSEIAFELYVRQSGNTSKLQSGSYRLSQAESVPKIVSHLTSGNTDTFSITFLPGATLSKHREVLLSAGYSASEVDAALGKSYQHPVLEGKPSDADLEGYIYGETYNFPATATVEDIIIRTLDQLEVVVEENNLVDKYKQQGFTLYEGLTMASIIQREVVTPDDAAQVAQVFKKRYDMGMQLGSDVTYQYIADKTGQSRSVNLDSPYNTRRYAGLPPGPISSPGQAALIAVGSPAPGDFLYFLSGDDDKTYFARTNEEHERNIREHCQSKCQII